MHICVLKKNLHYKCYTNFKNSKIKKLTASLLVKRVPVPLDETQREMIPVYVLILRREFNPIVYDCPLEQISAHQITL